MWCAWKNHDKDILYEIREYLVAIKVATRQEDGLMCYHDSIIRSCMDAFYELFLKYELKKKEYTYAKSKLKTLASSVKLEESFIFCSMQIKMIKKCLCDIHAEMEELFWLMRDHVHRIDKHCSNKTWSVGAETVPDNVAQEALNTSRIDVTPYPKHVRIEI